MIEPFSIQIINFGIIVQQRAADKEYE